MPEAVPSPQIVRFGVFELDLRAGELRKQGLKVKLQERPMQILALLLDHPGEVVTRGELRRQLWPADTFVDFDHSVNTAINKLREALGDSAGNPRFVETLPRHGYRFVATASGPGRTITEQAKQQEKLRLAVLPLDNLSGDPAEEYFADGMTEELITQLAVLRPERLGVIARTSTMKYKQTTKGIDEIGRELGVGYIVEGSVRRAGRKVHISAQLIQVCDQTHLWARSYEHEMSGVLTIQSEVAQSIAAAIQVQLTPEQRGRWIRSTRAAGTQVYEAYLRGRFYLNRANPGDHEKAIEYFQQAVDEDPLYAPAYAGIADTCVFLAFYRGLPREFALKARAAANKAIELDPNLAGAHTSLAIIKALSDWDWAGAEAEFRCAIELDPGSSDAHRVYGEFLSFMGKCEQAIAEARQGRDLDPLSANANYDLAFALTVARRYDEAIEQLKKILEFDPAFFPAHAGLAHLYAFQSSYEDALAELALAGTRPELVAWIHALAGRETEARKALAEAIGKKGPAVSPATFSLIYFLLGEKDRAFECLERGFEQRDWLMIFLKAFPPFDPMRIDPRFQDLLRRMNFTP